MTEAVAADHLRQLIERVERLEEEKAAMAADIREIYAEANGEYPLREGAGWSQKLQALGAFKVDPLPLQAISDQREAALLMTDRVRYDH